MSKKILVVEDDQALCDLYKEVLTAEGYEVIQALDGEYGFNEMKKGGYDLILLDYKLPKLNGLDILRKIQINYPGVTNGTVLLLTNTGEESVVADALTLGAKGYLIKADFTPEMLISEIKKYITG